MPLTDRAREVHVVHGVRVVRGLKVVQDQSADTKIGKNDRQTYLGCRSHPPQAIYTLTTHHIAIFRENAHAFLVYFVTNAICEKRIYWYMYYHCEKMLSSFSCETTDGM